MLKPLIRTIDRWRFELPLALVFGAAAAFATIVMPADLFGRLPGVAASRFAEPIQIGTGAIVGIVALALGYLAMRRPSPPAPAPEIVEDEEISDPAMAERLVRLRRADAHPDAPPRQPIRASRDLGEPFMEVGATTTSTATFAHVPEHVIPDGDYVEVGTGAPENAPPAKDEIGDEIANDIVDGPAPCTHVETGAPIETPSPIEAFKPEADRAPIPARASRASLDQMMERLTLGLERRGGRPITPPPAAILAEALARPREARPELRDALDELNRLAGRR